MANDNSMSAEGIVRIYDDAIGGLPQLPDAVAIWAKLWRWRMTEDQLDEEILSARSAGDPLRALGLKRIKTLWNEKYGEAKPEIEKLLECLEHVIREGVHAKALRYQAYMPVDEEVAESEVRIKIYRGIITFDRRKSQIKTWVSAIIRNYFVDLVRKHLREQEGIRQLLIIEETKDRPPGKSIEEQEEDDDELRRITDECLAQLVAENQNYWAPRVIVFRLRFSGEIGRTIRQLTGRSGATQTRYANAVRKELQRRIRQA